MSAALLASLRPHVAQASLGALGPGLGDRAGGDRTRVIGPAPPRPASINRGCSLRLRFLLLLTRQKPLPRLQRQVKERKKKKRKCKRALLGTKARVQAIASPI